MKRAHGRPNCKWENNIKMNLKELGFEYDSPVTGWKLCYKQLGSIKF
jgi:hypothetical protein